MKYVIIGAGGNGGVVGAYMTRAGKDVTLIARGTHLAAMKEHGLVLERLHRDDKEVLAVKASDMEHFEEKADVVFVCVKGYSLDSTVPFIRKIAHENTIVIPILNIYGTGGKLQEQLPELLVTDGCIYVSANIKEPGCILMHADIVRVVFGVRRPEEYRPQLPLIEQDLREAGIEGILSRHIRRDALQKFSYVSPIGVAGLYYQAVAADFQKEGAPRELFKQLIREVVALAAAMGITFEQDLVETNLQILTTLAPEATTSMQRDVMMGKESEIDGLVYEVVRLGEQYQVEVPGYVMAAEKFRKMNLK